MEFLKREEEKNKILKQINILQTAGVKTIKN